jgi:hypothetical protein
MRKFWAANGRRLTPWLLLTLPLLYLATLARTAVLGDPTEYTFVANILGIAHPPGYAFFTLLGKLFQTVIPVGPITWRMHLLSAVSGTIGAAAVMGTILAYARHTGGEHRAHLDLIAALFGGLLVGTATNHWQHSIHANPHVITGTFLLVNLYLLTRWGTSGGERWLLGFSLSAGLGVAHHPLTVFGFPAYTLFVLWARPSILRDWRTLLKMVLLALLGLSVWLYFPLRSPMDPGFGPTTMNTLDGFLDHILARGLSDSLPYYSLAEQPLRAVVFGSILRLQYSLPILLLALLGLFWGERPSANPHPRVTGPILRLLYLLAFAGVYTFVISLKAQDIMAYLIGPLGVVGLFAGLGLLQLLRRLWFRAAGVQAAEGLVAGTAVLLFLAGPLAQLAWNLPRISLREYSEGEDYVNAVFAWEDQAPGATLLNDWERMTPLWYARFVESRWPDPAVVRPELISTGGANPWLEGIFTHLPGGPVYLSNFRPAAIAGTEFRLRPSAPFYQVVEPGEAAIPENLTRVTAGGGEISIVGYELPPATAAGDFVPFTLAMQAPAGTADYYVPVLTVGDLRFEFTTDSHLITPSWQPGEVIVERFDFALPHALPAGRYPVTLTLKNLSTDTNTPLNLSLGELAVTAADRIPRTDHLLANFRQRVGLVDAAVWQGVRRTAVPWNDPTRIITAPGDVLNVVLHWEALDYAEESYTIFVHLIDAANRPYLFLDYTPLGGAVPTHLWIPKWLPGQQFTDPYRMMIPSDLAPGIYYIEVGVYEMVSGRRLHIADQAGNLNGDRFILGPLTVAARPPGP